MSKKKPAPTPNPDDHVGECSDGLSLSASPEGWARFVVQLNERERVKLALAIRKSFEHRLKQSSNEAS